MKLWQMVSIMTLLVIVLMSAGCALKQPIDNEAYVKKQDAEKLGNLILEEHENDFRVLNARLKKLRGIVRQREEACPCK